VVRLIVAKRTLWMLAKYLLAFAILGYVVYANWDPPNGRGLAAVWQAHVVERQPINGNALVLALALIAASLLLTLYRWHVLIRAQDLPVPRSTAIRVGLLGYFFNTFLPGSCGDVVKAAVVARSQEKRATAVATVIMDRILGLWSMIAFAALLGGFCMLIGVLDYSMASPSQIIVLTAAGIVCVTVLGWFAMGWILRAGSERVAARLARLPRIGHLAAELWQVVAMYRNRPGTVAAAIGMSWISDVGCVVALYCCGLTLWDGRPDNPLPTLIEHFLIWPIGSIIAAIPLFPGGAGINEAGFGGLYSLFGSAASNGIVAALVYRLVCWTVGLVGYLASQWSASSVEKAATVTDAQVGVKPVEQLEHATLDGLA
jgi:uncharacterized membrane protein YbhN (UPF0104 family)